MNLERLGWSSFFELQLEPEERQLYRPARVMEEQKNLYWLMGESGESLGEVSGRMRHHAVERGDLPAVGDWVLIHPRPGETRSTIHRVLQRKSKFSRKIAGEKTSEQIVAANVDTIFLMSSLNHELNLRRLERYLTLAWQSGAVPVLLLNKADLCDHPAREASIVASVASGVAIHIISALTNQGLEALEPYLHTGQTIALLGSSGVGKSTLVNRLAGREIQQVQEIRLGDDRGRHTTSFRQLVLLSQGGILLDTPGLRELQLWDSDSGFQQSFHDVESLAIGCQFRDCRHQIEPGCAVRVALNDGTLDAARFESYLKLQRELAYLSWKKDIRTAMEEKKKLKRLFREYKRVRHRW